MAVTRKDIPQLIRSLYKEAGNIQGESKYDSDLDLLFSTTSWGFREIILVCVIGRYLDSDFNPYTDLYSCKPRAIYEGPIRNTLLEIGIPNRKSGPLNIAKAAKCLDEEWAAQRRPKEVADATVRCVKAISRMDAHELHDFAVDLMNRFRIEADRVGQYQLTIEEAALDPDGLYAAICHMILNAPDSGNTPQRIVGLLMLNYFKSIHSPYLITGVYDRASVTSTTSKKPGDIQEEYPGGTVHKVYEVTIKPFDATRMRDSYDALVHYAEEHDPVTEVIVLCRKQDCPPEYQNLSSLCLGKIIYRDVLYVYYDLFEWCYNQILRMDNDAREAFLQEFNDYVSDPNTDLNVKEQWFDCAVKYLDVEGKESSLD